MNLLYPYALWGLLALSVPIIIHLLSKKRQKLIYFGTLKFLEPSDAPSSRSIRLSEYTLLLIRMLFLSALVLAIAQPLFGDKDNHHYRYIESPFHRDQTYISSFAADEIIPFTYSKEDSVDCQYFPSAWALIHHINNNGDSNTVYSTNHIKDFKGSAVSLLPHNSWISLPLKSTDFAIDTLPTSEGLLLLENREMNGNIFFEKRVKSGNGNYSDHIKVQIIHGQGSEAAAIQLNNFFKNLSSVLPLTIEVSKEEAEWYIHIDTLVNMHHDLPVIQWSPDDHPIVIHPFSENKFFMKGAINRSAIIEGNFALLLSDILTKYKIPLSKHDHRQMSILSSEEEVNDKITNAKTASYNKSRTHWIWLLVLLFLITERWIVGKNA